MNCPSCGAPVNGAFCEYCGAMMPVERVETTTVNAEHVTINNYFGHQPQSAKASISGKAAATSSFEAGNLTGVSSKSRLVALLLCFFFGFLGAHRFYTGRYLLGAVYLLTVGLLGFGWLVDIVLAALGRLRDRSGLQVSRW